MAAQAPDRPSALDGAPRLGRRIGLFAFWFGALYLAVVGFHSIGGAILSPTAKADLAPDSPAACGAALADLRAELYARHEASMSLSKLEGGIEAGGRVAAGDNRAFFTGWDARFHALQNHCEQPALGPLWRLRHQLEGTWQRFARVQRPIAIQIEQKLPPRGGE